MEYEEAFVQSWDMMENRCAIGIRDLPVAGLAAPIQALVREMRRRGYDRVFRAGMAFYDIVLSRSAEHGLRNDQPSVTVNVSRHLLPGGEDGRMIVYYGTDWRSHFVEERYQLTPRLEAALAELTSAPID